MVYTSKVVSLLLCVALCGTCVLGSDRKREGQGRNYPLWCIEALGSTASQKVNKRGSPKTSGRCSHPADKRTPPHAPGIVVLTSHSPPSLGCTSTCPVPCIKTTKVNSNKYVCTSWRQHMVNRCSHEYRLSRCECLRGLGGSACCHKSRRRSGKRPVKSCGPWVGEDTTHNRVRCMQRIQEACKYAWKQFW